MSWLTSWFWSSETSSPEKEEKPVRKFEYDKTREFSYDISPTGWIKVWLKENKLEIIFHLNQIESVCTKMRNRRKVILIKLKSEEQNPDSLFRTVEIYAGLGRGFYKELQQKMMGFV